MTHIATIRECRRHLGGSQCVQPAGIAPRTECNTMFHGHYKVPLRPAFGSHACRRSRWFQGGIDCALMKMATRPHADCAPGGETPAIRVRRRAIRHEGLNRVTIHRYGGGPHFYPPFPPHPLGSSCPNRELRTVGFDAVRSRCCHIGCRSLCLTECVLWTWLLKPSLASPKIALPFLCASARRPVPSSACGAGGRCQRRAGGCRAAGEDRRRRRRPARSRRLPPCGAACRPQRGRRRDRPERGRRDRRRGGGRPWAAPVVGPRRPAASCGRAGRAPAACRARPPPPPPSAPPATGRRTSGRRSPGPPAAPSPPPPASRPASRRSQSRHMRYGSNVAANGR